MPAFPTDLPSPVFSSYSETPANLVIRSQMDQGPAKTRRRFTAGVRPVKMELPFLTEAQLQDFDDFFVNDLYSGASTFTMTNPRTDTMETYRFVSPPTYQPVGDRQFTVKMDLEQMP